MSRRRTQRIGVDAQQTGETQYDFSLNRHKTNANRFRDINIGANLVARWDCSDVTATLMVH